jgi:hypothetical protein
MSPAEYQAKRDWLRSNPHGVQAQMVRRELRAWDRKLESEGVTVEAWLESSRTRRPGLGDFHRNDRVDAIG